MSNTTITPTVTGLTLAGVAGTPLLTITPTVSVTVQGEAAAITWPNIPNGSPGAATPQNIRYRAAVFQVTGTFGSGGSVQIEGSNDAKTFVKLSPAALVAAGFFAALGDQERPKYLRPNVTAGDSTTALTVTGWLS